MIAESHAHLRSCVLGISGVACKVREHNDVHHKWVTVDIVRFPLYYPTPNYRSGEEGPGRKFNMGTPYWLP